MGPVLGSSGSSREARDADFYEKLSYFLKDGHGLKMLKQTKKAKAKPKSCTLSKTLLRDLEVLLLSVYSKEFKTGT